MQRLILMRHGKAERASVGGDDARRRLTERGAADSRLMGKLLADEGLAPDLASYAGKILRMSQIIS